MNTRPATNQQAPQLPLPSSRRCPATDRSPPRPTGAGPAADANDDLEVVDGQGRPARRRRSRRRGCRAGRKVKIFRGEWSADSHLSALGTGVSPRRVGCRQPNRDTCHDSLGQQPEASVRLTISQTRRAAIHRTQPPTPAQQRPSGNAPARSATARSLIIGHANVRSLMPNMDSVQQTLSDHKIDVFCLTETWLSENVKRKFLVFPGYKMVRCDRPEAGTRGGGVAILYREQLKCDTLSITSDSVSSESLWVSISGGGRRSVTVGVFYRPPSQPTAAGLDSLHHQLQAAIATGRPVFCLGDFNVNLLCPSAPSTRLYTSVLSDLNLSQLISSPTRFNPPSILDHIITSLPISECSVTIPPEPIADHMTILARVPLRRHKSPRKSFQIRPWRKVNWDALCLHLLQADWQPLYRAEGIESKLEEFMKVWLSAIDIYCPTKTVTPRRPHCPWVENNPELREIMDERDRAFTIWRASGAESDLSTYRHLRNRVKRLLAKSKRDYLCSSMLSDRTNFWRNIRNFAIRPGTDSSSEPLGTVKADEFNRDFASVGPRIATELKERHIGNDMPEISHKPPRVISTNLILHPVTLPELSKYLNELSSSKAVGVDGVPLPAIKNCFAVLGPHLLHVINASIVNRVFPAAWKMALVVPIHKSGPRHVANNFRPISILPVLSKLCEKAVCAQLSAYFVKCDLFSPSQYAYRPCHSTEDAVLDVTEWTSRRVDDGHVVAITSLDLSKAFDSVDHSVLLMKLQWYGVDPTWFKSYLVGRRQMVRGGSLFLPLSHGVPQGSLIGPILFSIFTNDLPSYLPHGRLVSYADDTQLLDSAHPDDLASLKSRQETSLLAVQSYFTANSLKMNPSKTTLLLIGTPNSLKKITSFHLNFHDFILKPSSSVKILGVTIDSNLTWEAHISTVVKKCNSFLFCLHKIRHHLSADARQLLIQAHVFPLILYCLSVWGGATANRLGRVQKALNFAARIVTGARRSDHISPILTALGWRTVSELVNRRDCMAIHRALNDFRAPTATRALFSYRADVSARTTRASSTGVLELPGFRLSMSRRSFSYRAAATWNRLPQQLRSSRTRARLTAMLDEHALP